MQNLSKIKNSIYLKYSTVIDSSATEVFTFLKHLDKHFCKLTKDHIEYQILNNDSLKGGALVLCKEQSKKQFVEHLFKVEVFIEPQLILLVSKPSNGKVDGRNVQSNTYVQNFLEVISENKTRLTTTVVIQFPNAIIKLLATIFGGTKLIWQSHLLEETESIKREVEKLAFSWNSQNPIQVI